MELLKGLVGRCTKKTASRAQPRDGRIGYESCLSAIEGASLQPAVCCLAIVDFAGTCMPCWHYVCATHQVVDGLEAISFDWREILPELEPVHKQVI